MWEVWQYCAASLAVLQYEEAGRRYPGTGRTGHEYSSTDTWPYHSVRPCQVWQYPVDAKSGGQRSGALVADVVAHEIEVGQHLTALTS